MTAGGDQYTALILHTLLLVFVLAAGTKVMYGIIRERTLLEKPGSTDKPPAGPEIGTKDGE
jgi:hypothetical protein